MLYPKPFKSFASFRIFNIGDSQPIELLYFIEVLEDNLGVKAIRNFKPMQPGDVESTISDTQVLERWIGFKPNTSIEKGISNFVNWYKDFSNLN